MGPCPTGSFQGSPIRREIDHLGRKLWEGRWMIINEGVIFLFFFFSIVLFPPPCASLQSKQVMLLLRLERSFHLLGFEPLPAQPEGFSVRRVPRLRLRRECQPG